MRVQHFPAAGTKVPASEFIITGGGCAANAAVTTARLGGRVAFAGPLGGPDDAVSVRILSDLAKEGIDCSGVERVSGGTASVSLILLDATGEKTIATRRGVKLGDTLPNDAAKLVADADAVLVDNRFPQFVMEVCRAAQARKIPIVIDLDQETKVGRSPARARNARDVLDGSIASPPRAERTMVTPSRSSPNTFQASSPSRTARKGFTGSSVVSCDIFRHSGSR